MNISHFKILLREKLGEIWKRVLQHKIISIILAVVILSGSYYAYGKLFGTTAVAQYVFAAVEKGTLVSSVSGSGQVLVLDQMDIKPKVSGDVIYIGVKEGQEVPMGALLAQLDSQNARKTVRDAQINLDSAKLSLDKLMQSSASPEKIQEDSFNSISDVFLDLPTVMGGAEIVINGSTLSNNQSNKGFYTDFVYSPDQDEAELFVSAANNDYAVARTQYDSALALYKNTSRYASSTTTLDLLNKVTDTTKSIAQALKSEQSLLDYLADYVSKHSGKSLPALVNTYRSNLQTYIGQVNGHLSSLINAQNTVKNAPLDVDSQELSVEQRENALSDAQQQLADYYIRAPFGGIVASVDVKNGDSVSPSASMFTFITKKKLAQISLNEVDIAKIKMAQKTTLTFDAIPDLVITGEVSQIDAIGAAAQGVVTYNIQIAFDTQDDRIKPGMSVSAAVITDVKQDILLVPNTAVKSQSGAYYVEIQDAATSSTIPIRQPVEIGTSNDTMTEITNGLKAGDSVVTRTIAGSTQGAATVQQNSSFRIPGMTGGAGR
ncbi:MAG: efflux RND transporter periplasmic adaptor subunit [Patescibacteria group bacterium]